MTTRPTDRQSWREFGTWGPATSLGTIPARSCLMHSLTIFALLISGSPGHPRSIATAIARRDLKQNGTGYPFALRLWERRLTQGFTGEVFLANKSP
ncbi:hypothetical protein AJ87_26930 [Rhizobium yanglingense]|nr:hypothetical protein AJ87_26930 [Rhizobium yanglingense]